MRMTEEEYFRITGKRLGSVKTPYDRIREKPKYNNEKTNGYDSKLENSRAQQLHMEQKLGIIKDLQEQKVFVLQDAFKIPSNKTKTGLETVRAITYVADFFYHRVGENLPTVEDTKGNITEVYKIKKKMFLKRYGEQYIFIESKDKYGNEE